MEKKTEKMPDWMEMDVDHVELDDIPAFVTKAMCGYEHDYDSVVKAFVACLCACAWAINQQAGLTGFQAGFIPLLFMQKWNGVGDDIGLRVIDYDNMLYPQYADYFDKTVSRDIYNSLVDKARQNLKDLESEEKSCSVHPNVVAHWQSIAAGELPFGYSIKSDV